MTTRRIKSSSETAPARPAQSSMSAEIIAAGTTAGALMLGVVQADAARKDAALQAAAPAFDADDPLSVLLAAGDITMEASAPQERALAHAETIATQAPAAREDDGGPSIEADTTTTMPTIPAAPVAAETSAEPPDAAADMPPVAEIEAIASRISDAVVSAIGQVGEGLPVDQFAAQLGKSIAVEIADAATAIARDLNAASTVDAGLARIADAVPGVETIAAGLQTQIEPLGTLTDQLAALPADMLGAETVNDLVGGLLSDLFYSDGGAASDVPAADPLATQPVAGIAWSDLSDAASSFVEGAAATSTDLIGLSYADAPDMPYAGMQSSLGALHVI